MKILKMQPCSKMEFFFGIAAIFVLTNAVSFYLRVPLSFFALVFIVLALFTIVYNIIAVNINKIYRIKNG